MEPLRILIIEGKRRRRKGFSDHSPTGCAVHTATDVNEALSMLAQGDFHVIILGMVGPDSPLALVVKAVRARSREAEVVVKTIAAKSEKTNGEIQLSKFGFLPKRPSLSALLDELRGASEPPLSSTKAVHVIQDSNTVLFGNMLLGDSAPSRRLVEDLDLAGSCEAICMLNGETGTGKDLAARYIHKISARADKPFVVVNLPAIPKDLIESALFGHERGSFTGAISSQQGKFESAGGGTIFLDEIGDLPLEHQVKLLRIIEDGEIERVGSNRPIKGDARIIAATSQRLDQLLSSGKFRRDLYYRLVVMPIHVPPLRERRNDIPALSLFFLNRYTVKYQKKLIGFAPDVYEIFARFSWSGNIRELSHMIERMVIYASPKKEFLDIPDLPQDFLEASAEKEREAGITAEKEEFEKRRIVESLRNANFNFSRAARDLRLPVETLRYRIKKFGIMKDGPDPTA